MSGIKIASFPGKPLAARRAQTYKRGAMHIVLVDDSIAFDGMTPGTRPLGGAEKAFVHLATALSRRGHHVTAVNRCREACEIDGVMWAPWEGERPSHADVLIAYRRPELLTEIEIAPRRVLWMLDPAQKLEVPPAHDLLMRFLPSLAFVSSRQVEGWGSPRGIVARIIAPAVASVYLSAEALNPGDPPQAVVTAHPQQLQRLVSLWRSSIAPSCPNAELVVYSALMARAARGVAIDETYRPIFEKLQQAESDGVRIAAPLADDGMVEAYRHARVHLYPGSGHEMLCSTLMESQAVGIPAVAFDRGAVAERIENGQTGYVVPDEEAFCNLAVRFLSDEDLFWTTSQDTVTYQRRRCWDDVALEFEALWRLTV